MSLPAALAPLAALRQWVTYRLVPAANGKTDKLPCDWRTGRVASAQEPGNWCTYDQAAIHAVLADQGTGSGSGFVLSAGDPYWFLDIDQCLLADGQWSPLAIELCSRLSGCAVEISQSGRGLHIIGRGVVPPHRCKNIPLGLELYIERRFVAITGNHATGSCDHDGSEALAGIVEQFFAPAGTGSSGPLADWTSEPCEGWVGPTDDADLIRRACAAKPSRDPAAMFGRGEQSVSFNDLWTANTDKLATRWPDSGDRAYDASAADQSLAVRLAWWTGRDCERIERLMRMSGLFREKYERRDWIERTVMSAAGLVTTVCSDPVPPPPVATPAGSTRSTPVLTAGQAKDKTDHLTIEYWLAAFAVVPRYDQFAGIVRIGDERLDDNLERDVWMTIRAASGLKFAWDLYGHTLRNLAWANRYHPLRDYLDARQAEWDGRPRVDTWLCDFLGAEDTPYVRCVGSLFLLALVRRARVPGAKFDEMLVLEGAQGLEKSSALAALAGDEWFTDEISVGMAAKEMLEVTLGKWIVEAPELKGLTGRATDQVKAFLSRRFDKARMAFERNTTERGRQFVVAATTNDGRYLDDQTGNRRIWPVRMGAIDLARLTAARDQLWAEAAVREAAGESIRMPRRLWAAAGDEQADRMLADTFREALEDVLGDRTGRVRGKDVLDALRVPLDQQMRISRKFGDTMRAMGWSNSRAKVAGERDRHFVKGDPARHIILVAGALNYAEPDVRAV